MLQDFIPLPCFLRSQIVNVHQERSNPSSNAQNISKIGKNIVVLVYGSYYKEVLLKDLVDGYCTNSTHIKVVRSHTCVEHDAVILHFIEYDRFLRECVGDRYQKKKTMVIFAMEPPWSVKLTMHIEPTDQNYYILTYSYHRSSLLRSTYFEFYRENSWLNTTLLWNEFTNRKKAGVSTISDCQQNHTVRIDYIKRLSNMFPVDRYGACVDKIISNEEFKNLCPKYMFYLSFENSVCDDYITEKYCIPLKCGAIPVVMSNGHNLVHLILGSYINALDYESPEHLAQHLSKVSTNFTLYQRYFIWIKYYKIKPCKFYSNICEMLDLIYQNTLAPLEDKGLSELTNVSSCLSGDDMSKYL
ncbi:Alpha-(1,3)-fucosyltransferase C [Thelohanellus kitauei]|uniref:Fucosyltransferase n=1 Tax=Thelohanellus kitauei TaxID=669202 RepID=A0A0C2N6H4_THEKT|nr:Alpha-(1,3)-fucosyltransferase C [Thelohanellus kitauei]